eukprot:jgi/Mesen1/6743/ME000344S06021
MDPTEIKHRLHEAFKSTVEFITPHRSVTAFKDKGVLTPDEFVEAGDNLVSKCPTWSWEAGDPAKRKPYLPRDKQFLITRNVPCLKRVDAVEGDFLARGGEVQIEGEGDEDGGWLAAYGAPSLSGGGGGGAVQGRDSRNDAAFDDRGSDHARRDDDVDDDDDDVPDMAEFEDEDNAIDQDPATLQTPYLVAQEPDDDNILRTRTYDLSMSYDKYYQTPRFWLFGYDEARQPLSPEEMLQDVSQDHARKTVTIEDHAHQSGKFASVHPCRHAAVMKKIVGELASRGGEPRVD